MGATIEAVRKCGPTKAAVPVAVRSTAREIRRMVDDMICVQPADALDGIGRWCDGFRQPMDQRVRRHPDEASSRHDEKARSL